MKIRSPKGFAIIILTLVTSIAGYAQGNLVNLYDWTVVSNTPPPPGTVYVYGSFQAASSNSGFFNWGAESHANGGLFPNMASISNNLTTIPGQAYEIACTSEASGEFGGSISIQFGNFSESFLLPVVDLGSGGFTDVPTNIDFTVVASSASTTMEIQPYLVDYPGGVQLSDFSVVAVPEPAVPGLWGVVIISLLGYKRWQRSR